MKKSSPCYNSIANEDGKNPREKIESGRKKEIKQESPNMGNVKIDNATSSSGNSSSNERKSEHNSPSSPKKKLNPPNISQSDNCCNLEPCCSGLQLQLQQNEIQGLQDRESNEEKRQSSKSRKHRRSGHRIAQLVAIDNSNRTASTQAEISRRVIEFRSFSNSSLDQNEDDKAKNGMDKTIEGIVIKNLIDLNEFNLKTSSESDSDTTSETSVSTTTTVISATTIPDMARSNSENFEHLTEIKIQASAIEDETNTAGHVQTPTLRRNCNPQEDLPFAEEIESDGSEDQD